MPNGALIAYFLLSDPISANEPAYPSGSRREAAELL